LKNIFICGDSFCFSRTNPNTHWPLLLANNLNMQLEGNGFPGFSWWPTRTEFLNYKKTTKFDNTDLFVFCHTDPNRFLSSNIPSLFLTDNATWGNVSKTYYKYLYEKEIAEWSMLQWFNELNTLLEDRKVIHLCSFTNTQIISNVLNGHKASTDLLTLSKISSFREGIKFEDIKEGNHFTDNTNIRLANFLTDYFKNEMVESQTTKYFNIYSVTK